MADSTRPPMQAVQKSLIIGVVVGLLFGCIIGAALTGLYIQQNPPVYSGGAFPSEMSDAYQNHYLAMTVDSYLVNQQAEVAKERLKAFDDQTKVLIIGERSAAYVSAGRGPESQIINRLAVELQQQEGWDEEQVKAAVGYLMTKYQSDPARAQAVSSLSAQLLDGQIPVPSDGAQPPPEGAPDQQPADAPDQPAAAPPAQADGGTNWLLYAFCCLGLLIVLLIIYLLGRRQFAARRAPTKQEIDWEGEGTPPFKAWNATYEIGPTNYEEYTTLETDEDVFLGECGIEGKDSVPGSSPKQFISFDVGLFDKTDITTLANIVMSEHAYNDESIRAKYEGKAKTEVILAEPGKEFAFETTAMRVEAKIVEMEYGEGGNVYFEKLKIDLTLFLQEGADLKKGTMDIPDEYM